jgi:hypothetical protein
MKSRRMIEKKNIQKQRLDSYREQCTGPIPLRKWS